MTSLLAWPQNLPPALTDLYAGVASRLGAKVVVPVDRLTGIFENRPAGEERMLLLTVVDPACAVPSDDERAELESLDVGLQVVASQPMVDWVAVVCDGYRGPITRILYRRSAQQLRSPLFARVRLAVGGLRGPT